MSDRLISERDRRALVWGLVVVMIAALLLRGGPSLGRWTVSEQTRARRLTLAVDDARRAAEAFAWMRDSAELRQARAATLDTLFLDGVSPALAAADLASELSDDAAAVDVQIGALQADPESDSSATIRRVRARASISGDLAAIMHFLTLVEGGPPLLTVREVALSRRDGQVGAGPPEIVHAEIVIEGLVKPKPRVADSRTP